MILVAAVAAAALVVVLRGGRLGLLAPVPIRLGGAATVALVVQVVLVQWTVPGVGEREARVLHLATYGMVGGFLWANRRLPGLWLVALGGGLNLLAVAANGGVMPATTSALARSGRLDGSGFENSAAVADARLSLLGDVFAVPASWPLANVFSIGDVVLVVGIGLVLDRLCRPVSERSTPPPPLGPGSGDRPAVARPR